LDVNRPRLILVIAIAALALFLCRAGAMPLIDPDEGRYALIARQMATSGDCLVPRLFGSPYLEKPSLLYWLTSAIFRVFGAFELTARHGPALAAAFGVAAAGWFAQTFSPTAGILASAVLALCGLYAVIARTLVTDMLFSLTLAAALFAFFKHREARTPTIRWALAFWFSLALATLSKGPVAIVIGGLVIVIDAMLGRSLKSLFDRRLVATSPILLAVALSWFALIQAKYPTFFSFYVWKQHLERAAGSEHAEPFYWLVPWLLGRLMPWPPSRWSPLQSGGGSRANHPSKGAPFDSSSSGRRRCSRYSVRSAAIWRLTSSRCFHLLRCSSRCFSTARSTARFRANGWTRAWGATALCFMAAAGALPVSVLAHPAVGLDTRILIAVPLLVGGTAIFRARVSPQRTRRVLAVVVASALLYVVLGCLAPRLARPSPSSIGSLPTSDRMTRAPSGASTFRAQPSTCPGRRG
jgi:4-amino-4-deoxy-L-arabinose transferase-like glycosyltransferase